MSAEERSMLEESFWRMAARSIADTPVTLEQGERRALDELVFDLLGFSAAERESTRAALLDSLDGRRQRARRIGEEGD